MWRNRRVVGGDGNLTLSPILTAILSNRVEPGEYRLKAQQLAQPHACCFEVSTSAIQLQPVSTTVIIPFMFAAKLPKIICLAKGPITSLGPTGKLDWNQTEHGLFKTWFPRVCAQLALKENEAEIPTPEPQIHHKPSSTEENEGVLACLYPKSPVKTTPHSRP